MMCRRSELSHQSQHYAFKSRCLILEINFQLRPNSLSCLFVSRTRVFIHERGTGVGECKERCWAQVPLPSELVMTETQNRWVRFHRVPTRTSRRGGRVWNSEGIMQFPLEVEIDLRQLSKELLERRRQHRFRPSASPSHHWRTQIDVAGIRNTSTISCRCAHRLPVCSVSPSEEQTKLQLNKKKKE